MRKLAPLVTMFICFTYLCQGQDLYSIKRVTDQTDTLNPFFRIVGSSLRNEFRVFHVFSSDTLVSSYLYFFPDTPDSPKLIKDKLLDTTFRSLNGSLVVKVVNSESLETQSPIEEVFLLGFKKAIIDHLTDSLPKSRNNKQRKFISVNGRIVLDAYHSNGVYDYQSRPAKMINAMVDLNPEIFGLPFNLKYFKSTESNSYGNSVNNFKFTFDYEKFSNNLKNRITNDVDSIALLKVDKHSFQTDKLALQRAKLSDKLSSEYFKTRYITNKRIVESAKVDSTIKTTDKYKLANIELDSMDKDINQLIKLDSIKNYYDSYVIDTNKDLNLQKKRLEINSSFGDKQRLKRINLLNQIFSSIRRFQFGQVNPNYNLLILGGTSLDGFDIEINKSNIYLAFTTGTTPVGIYPSHNVSNLQNFKLDALRIGVGNLDRLLLAFTFMRTNSLSYLNLGADSSGFRLPFHNHVFGCDLRYKSKGSEFGLEFATSESEYSSDQYKPKSLLDIEQLIQRSESSKMAFNLYANFRLNKYNTTLNTSVRRVGNDYVSNASPFIRRDNFRVEFRLSQPFIKQRVNFAITIRTDRDNLLGDKLGISNNFYSILSLSTNLKKFPKLNVSYSPNYSNTYNNYFKKATLSKTEMFQISLSKVKKKKEWVFSFTSFMNYTSSQTIDSKEVVYSFYQFGLSSSITNLNKGWSFNLLLSAIKSTQASLYEGWNLSVNTSKSVFKDKLNFNLGTSFKESYDRRLTLTSGISSMFSHGYSTSLTFDLQSVTLAGNTTFLLFSKCQIQKCF